MIGLNTTNLKPSQLAKQVILPLPNCSSAVNEFAMTQEQAMSNALNELLDAMHVHTHALVAVGDDYQKQSAIGRQFWLQQRRPQLDALAHAFGALNGWRVTREFALCKLCSARCHRYCGGLITDHALFYRDARARRNVAIVNQPYLSRQELAGSKLAATLATRGLRCQLPPNPFASFWYPGYTAFIVITRADVTMRWLPEQLTFGNDKDAA